MVVKKKFCFYVTVPAVLLKAAMMLKRLTSWAARQCSSLLDTRVFSEPLSLFWFSMRAVRCNRLERLFQKSLLISCQGGKKRKRGRLKERKREICGCERNKVCGGMGYVKPIKIIE